MFRRAVIAIIFLFSLALLMQLVIRPPLKVNTHGDVVTVDVMRMGEYHSILSELEIREATTGKTVYHIQAVDDSIGLWKFLLRAGENDVHLIQKGDTKRSHFSLIYPTDTTTFRLEPDIDYEIIAIGANFLGSLFPAKERFTVKGSGLVLKN